MSRRERNLEINELEMIWFLQSERDRGALTFREAVYQLVSLIPAGSVLGYGQVASLLGSPRAARQVGFALRALLPQQADPQQEDCIPWWRVLRTSGQIALKGDPERPENQRQLLRDEGVIVDDYTVDMTRFTWRIHDESTDPL